MVVGPTIYKEVGCDLSALSPTGLPYSYEIWLTAGRFKVVPGGNLPGTDILVGVKVDYE